MYVLNFAIPRINPGNKYSNNNALEHNLEQLKKITQGV